MRSAHPRLRRTGGPAGRRSLGDLPGTGPHDRGLFLPRLFFWVFRRIPVVHLRLPWCAEDQARYRRQERLALRIQVPVWIACALVTDVYCVVVLRHGVSLRSGLIVAGSFMIVATVDAVVAWSGRNSPRKKGLPLAFVHPAFVAALLDDRARDRVSNPDRRGGHGDVRDDYDDEPN